MKKKKVVVIGGGTGTYTVLSGLKKYPLDLSVIVSMMDSGGSNRILRDEFGILPTSDVRQCIVALASNNTNGIIRDLFAYRYSAGTGIEGMTFGNLFMAALSDIVGSQELAIEKTCDLLNVEGDIIPVTFDNSHLVARYENGAQVLGEHYIDEPVTRNGSSKIVELYLIPHAHANPKALKAIAEADLIVMGPGDLYTSIICNLIVDGVSEAIANSDAKKLYICNLMTKFGQTHNFSAQDHISALEKYIGKNTINYCLINSSEYPKQIVEKYIEENANPVADDLADSKNFKVIRGDFVSGNKIQKHKSDKLARSLIRHDSDKLAEAIMALI